MAIYYLRELRFISEIDISKTDATRVYSLESKLNYACPATFLENRFSQQKWISNSHKMIETYWQTVRSFACRATNVLDIWTFRFHFMHTVPRTSSSFIERYKLVPRHLKNIASSAEQSIKWLLYQPVSTEFAGLFIASSTFFHHFTQEYRMHLLCAWRTSAYSNFRLLSILKTTALVLA